MNAEIEQINLIIATGNIKRPYSIANRRHRNQREQEKKFANFTNVNNWMSPTRERVPVPRTIPNMLLTCK